MSKVNINISIPGDSDGFVSFECPYCEMQFKLSASDYTEHEPEMVELYCPYCGLTGNRDTFYTKEQVEHFANIAQNYRAEQIDKMLSDFSKKSNSKYLKVKHTPAKKQAVLELMSTETEEEIFQCSLCENSQKVFYASGRAKIYCAYCGVDV